jgi:hypothetical protein
VVGLTVLEARLEEVDDLRVQAAAAPRRLALQAFTQPMRHAQQKAIDVLPQKLRDAFTSQRRYQPGTVDITGDCGFDTVPGSGMKLLAVPAALLLLSSAAAAPIVGAEVKRRPTLAVVAESPLTVAGRGFRSFERVTVRTSVRGTAYTRRVRAGRTGGFTARFASVNAECHPFAVTAVGGRGSRAAARRIRIPPPCGIAIQP